MITKKLGRRILSFLLLLTMVLGTMQGISLTAYAADNNYLTFTGTAAFNFKANLKNGSLQYSTDAVNWSNLTSETELEVNNEKHILYLRGSGNSNKSMFGSKNHITITSTGTVECNGDIRTIIEYTNPDNAVMGAGCFQYMFLDCTSLTKAPKLPETNLSDDCYICMFSGCTNLTEAPELPATTLPKYCYQGMFRDCTSLTKAPELPATGLGIYCYSSMFAGCTGLTKAPELPATTLATGCYEYMFSGCTGLTEALKLPATTLTDGCYMNMFYGCSGIKLSAEKTSEYNAEYRIPTSGTGTTANNALNNMFSNTGGTFNGTPDINKTYYVHKDIEPVASVKAGDTTTYYSTFDEALAAWSENSTLTLLEDVERTAKIAVEQTKTLDLNGKTITLNTTESEQRVIQVRQMCTFTLKDSSGTDSGKITGVNTTNTWSGGLYINQRSTVNMYGGTITGNKSAYGAGVWIDGRYGNAGTGGTFNMYGGVITGNESTTGGGVYVGKWNDSSVGTGYFNMYGGTIKGNTADTASNVYIDYGVMTMTGGTIDGGFEDRQNRYVTVTFDANGGLGTMSQQYIQKNTATPIKSSTFEAQANKLFAVWNTQADGNGTSYSENQEYTVNGNSTLYAMWKDAVASVTVGKCDRWQFNNKLRHILRSIISLERKQYTYTLERCRSIKHYQCEWY